MYFGNQDRLCYRSRRSDLSAQYEPNHLPGLPRGVLLYNHHSLRDVSQRKDLTIKKQRRLCLCGLHCWIFLFRRGLYPVCGGDILICRGFKLYYMSSRVLLRNWMCYPRCMCQWKDFSARVLCCSELHFLYCWVRLLRGRHDHLYCGPVLRCRCLSLHGLPDGNLFHFNRIQFLL